jgi:hypothetical protein
MLINNIDDKQESIILEEKITCGKIKSKAKTLLAGHIDSKNVFADENDNSIKILTIEFDKILISCFNSHDLNLIHEHIFNSTIIISNDNNPKNSDSHLLVLPGHLTNIKKQSFTQMEININFKNFFPFNIPINSSPKFFMIWFKKLLPTGLIKKSNVFYKCAQSQIKKSNIIKNSIPVQQTQTFNVICKNKNSDKVIKKTHFNCMCRAFWIKMNISDYNNLEEFKIKLNGHTRIELTKNTMELVCDKKIINSNYILIFLNLELDCADWSIPADLFKICKIYLNSCNMTRIDSVEFSFKFINKYTDDNIQITSLSINNLSLCNDFIIWKLF